MVALSLLALMLLGMVAPSSGYHTGAPEDTCNTLTPNHNANPQTTPSPFSITFTPATFTPGGSSPVIVTLSTTSGATFKGFLLTTQYVGANAGTAGTFRNPPAVTKLICSNSAVTHSDVNSQSSLSFEWMPPPRSGGNVRFRATFVREKTTFWKDVRTTSLLVDSSAGSGTTNGSQPDPATFAVSPATTTVPPTAAGKVKKDASCGSSKGCYSDCKDNACSFLVTWSAGSSTDKVRMTMSGTVGKASGLYIALGLSNDDKMGSDSVVFCINEPNGVFLSYNSDEGKDNTLNGEPKDGLSDIEVSYADEVLTCSFSRVKAADNGGRRFALDKSYFLLYATGPGSENGPRYHDTVKPMVSTLSASLVDFSLDIGGSASDKPLIKVHGSLMIVAWIFAASIGIVLARYFKDAWPNNTWAGQKIWFQIHRACMVIALLATVTAFIIIFVEVGGYSDIQGKPHQKAHPILGIIVTVLTVTNPIMALFRPHPGTPGRPIFNWAHWIVGSGAHLLGVITIFLGMLVNTSGAPKYIIYILAAYVGWQVLLQFLLEIVQCASRKNESEELYEMTDINQGEPPKPSPQKGAASHKQLLLFLHLLVIMAFTVALIVVLNIGKDDS